MNCIVAISELYGIETMLIHGYSTKFTHIPTKFTKRIISDLGLKKGSDRKYYGDPDTIYEYFKSKYPDYIRRYNVHDYGALVSIAYRNMI